MWPVWPPSTGINLSCFLINFLYVSSYVFLDELVLPKAVAQAQLPLEEILASLHSDSPPLPQRNSVVPASSSQTLSLPISPVDTNKQFIPPLKHPLSPSLTPICPLRSFEFDPSRVLVLWKIQRCEKTFVFTQIKIILYPPKPFPSSLIWMSISLFLSGFEPYRHCEAWRVWERRWCASCKIRYFSLYGEWWS